MVVMWKASNTEVAKSTPTKLWSYWTNVASWPEQDMSLESASIHGDFAAGSVIALKPKSSPKVKVTLIEVTNNQSFSSVGKLPLAKLQFDHRVKTAPKGIAFTQSVTISGPLSGLFSKVMGNKMAENLTARMKNLVKALED